ncbi:MAG: tetratricopeptide repeat protein [Bryobacterales bacterium]|nr:tetratricopeptide repeat protein [Bryobacterales bacterium]
MSATPQEKQKPQEPPEEDETLKTREYAFNPLQANKEIKVGQFYLKKGKNRAAAMRFLEATRWDPTSAEAYLLLGDAREKMKDSAGSKEAYRKFLELSPDSKSAHAIRKKLGIHE